MAKPSNLFNLPSNTPFKENSSKMPKPSSLFNLPPNTPFKENSSKMTKPSSLFNLSFLTHHSKKTALKWLNHSTPMYACLFVGW